MTDRSEDVDEAIAAYEQALSSALDDAMDELDTDDPYAAYVHWITSEMSGDGPTSKPPGSDTSATSSSDDPHAKLPVPEFDVQAPEKPREDRLDARQPMSGATFTEPVGMSQETRERLPKLQGAIQFETGEDVTFGQAIARAAEEYLADLPETIDGERVATLIEQENTGAVKMSVEGKGSLTRVRGHIQFKTSLPATYNVAIAIATDHFLDDVPFPL